MCYNNEDINKYKIKEKRQSTKDANINKVKEYYCKTVAKKGSKGTKGKITPDFAINRNKNKY